MTKPRRMTMSPSGTVAPPVDASEVSTEGAEGDALIALPAAALGPSERRPSRRMTMTPASDEAVDQPERRRG